jgi:hypothetical protein
MPTSSHRVAVRYLAGATFDLQEFSKLKSPKDRVTYLQVNAKYLGKGMSRVVLDIGGGRVLKLMLRGADNPKANAMEAEFSVCLKGSTVVPHVLDHAKDYAWIIMEKATPVRGKFLTLLNTSLGMPEHLAFEDESDFALCLKLALRGSTNITPQLEWLTKHPTQWWSDLIAAVKTCGIWHTDMKAENWGILKGRLVLLDYGG